MIMTMHTGVTGYKLALGEVAPVLKFLTSRLDFKFDNVVIRDLEPEEGAPSAVVTSDVTHNGEPVTDYKLVMAYSGPISHAEDICSALAHQEAGRLTEPMCPRALKTIADFKRMVDVASPTPHLNMVWAIQVPEQRIYWLVAAVRNPIPNLMAYALTASTPR